MNNYFEYWGTQMWNRMPQPTGKICRYGLSHPEKIIMDDFIVEKNANTGETEIVEYKGNSETITIPEGITTIGESAFFNKELTKVIFPSTLRRIKKFAFGVNHLTELHFKSPVILDINSFRNNNIKKITGTIKELNITAFCDNPIMNQNLVFEAGLESIDSIDNFLRGSEPIEIDYIGTITLPQTIKNISGKFNEVILISPSLSLLQTLNYYQFKRLKIKTTIYNPELEAFINSLHTKCPVTYESGYLLESLRANKELWNLVTEIIGLTNSELMNQILEQLININKEYEIATESYKPKYHENFSLSCLPNIFSKTLEVKTKLMKIKEKLQEIARLESLANKVAQIIDIINSTNKDMTSVPDNMDFILNYSKLINDFELKKSILQELNNFIRMIDKIKRKNNPLISREYTLDNLWQILAKYNIIAKKKYQEIKPYHNLLMFLMNQIESIKNELEKCNPIIKAKLMKEAQSLFELKKYIENIIELYKTDGLIVLDGIDDLKRKLASTLNMLLFKCAEYKEYAPLINTIENYPTYKEKEIQDKTIPSINEILEQIYTLTDLYDIDNNTRKQVEKEIAEIMHKWLQKISQNDFIYPDIDSYIGKINVNDKLKFELGILKDLYKIVFDLNNYIEALSYFETLKR